MGHETAARGPRPAALLQSSRFQAAAMADAKRDALTQASKEARTRATSVELISVATPSDAFF